LKTWTIGKPKIVDDKKTVTTKKVTTKIAAKAKSKAKTTTQKLEHENENENENKKRK